MALKKITKLTPEQEAELPRFRQRYLDMACNGRGSIVRRCEALLRMPTPSSASQRPGCSFSTVRPLACSH
jgi:hypothetical protein